MSLFEELKRRNVFRVAAAYAVVGWVVLEVASIVAPALGLPEWTLTLLVFVGACGFPFALVFAWAFELTPGGLKRTEDVTPADSITPETGSKLTRVTIVLLSVALVLVLAERFLMQGEIAGEQVPASAGQGAPPSIAVLPFVNMSEDKSNEHFGDGLAEELLNMLAQVPELHVAARTSSFHFKDKDATIADIAKALNVETVLEGSIRRSGDTIRVVAQLISADDERHLWSEKYDRPLTDVFEVQDDIAQQIVSALLPQLDIKPPTSEGKGDIAPELYERFLLARHTYYQLTDESTVAAHQEFLDITEQAPQFGPAWSWLARSWLYLPDTSTDIAWPRARQAIDTALALNPDDALAYLALARLNVSEGYPELAIENVEKSLSIDPRLVDALIFAERPLVSLGRVDEAIESLDRARRLDPLHPEVLTNLAHLYNLQGNVKDAFEALDKLQRVNAVRAVTWEEHLYHDRAQAARALYFAELDWASGEPKLCDGCFAFMLLRAGLYEHPALQASRYRPVALANLGDRKAAELALMEVLAEMNDPQSKVEIQMMTYSALGEYQLASDILWRYWESLEVQRINDAFWEMHAMYLCKTSRAAGYTERARAVLPILAAEMKNWSKLHTGGYNFFQAQLAMLEDRDEDALAYLEAIAEEGDIGGYSDGGPLLFHYQVPDDPRFAAVLEKIVANYDRQMEILERLRASGMTAAEMRAEYLQEFE